MADKNSVADEDDSGYDSNDVEYVNARKAAAGRKQKRLDDAMQNLMSYPSGRELIWEHLSLCGIHRTSFSRDGLQMAFNEGERNIGLQLEAQVIRLCPQEFAKMHQEANIRDRAEREREKRLRESQKENKDG